MRNVISEDKTTKLSEASRKGDCINTGNIKCLAKSDEDGTVLRFALGMWRSKTWPSSAATPENVVNCDNGDS